MEGMRPLVGNASDGLERVWVTVIVGGEISLKIFLRCSLYWQVYGDGLVIIKILE